MRYQLQKLKNTNTVEFKLDINGTTEKTTLSVFVDGNDKEYSKTTLKFMKFGHMIPMSLALFIGISEDASLDLLETCGIK